MTRIRCPRPSPGARRTAILRRFLRFSLNSKPVSYTHLPLSYAAATLNKTWAHLTHRVHLDDPPQELPADAWGYNEDGSAISLRDGPFVDGDIYEFAYTARDPTVNGLGLAAVRDFNAWLRNAEADDAGHPNPLAHDVTRIYTEAVSQPGRMLNRCV